MSPPRRWNGFEEPPVRRKIASAKRVSKSMARVLGIAALTPRAEPTHIEVPDDPAQEMQRMRRNLESIPCTHLARSPPEENTVNVEE
jgi:hypothetical protein